MPLKPVDPATVRGAPGNRFRGQGRSLDRATRSEPANPGTILSLISSRRQSKAVWTQFSQSRSALSARVSVPSLRLLIMISSMRPKGKRLSRPLGAPVGGFGASERATKPLDVFGRGAREALFAVNFRSVRASVLGLAPPAQHIPAKAEATHRRQEQGDGARLGNRGLAAAGTATGTSTGCERDESLGGGRAGI
jgi:hypothetical protein